MIAILEHRLLRLVLVLAALLAALPAMAATVIRDAEIEDTIHRIADPVFEVAGLDRDSIDVYILQDPTLNAFVSGGQNLFVNTGLIVRTSNPDELRGVIAHETGHIAGGHLSRTVEARDQALAKTLLGAVLGVAAAVAGAPEVGTALMLGGASFGQSGVLAFSRSQEQSADQAAVNYLERLHESPEGLRDFFEVLDTQNLRISGGGNVYFRTHPLTQDRIRFMDDQVARSPYKGQHMTGEAVEAHRRMVAKLDGFLSNPQDVLRRRASDSIPDRYARAVALYRVPDVPGAVAIIDGLIGDEPANPYFHELKGQILFENGRVAEAVPPYREALRYRPDSALIRLGLARALLEKGDPAGADEAVALLEEATRLEPRNPGAWRFLGIAYGKAGREGMASMALAEQAVLVGDKNDARLYIRRAENLIQPNDPNWIHLQDLVRAVDDMPNPQRRR
ncbi:MAG TPA: M48 family metalloprotease [Geminicoccaceae bacterium]|nr:M48 family metalloprotease [Geminicoccus sp.]HMU50252.1 M48 family metalloprotease [Geminicoccaceae bacterium]